MVTMMTIIMTATMISNTCNQGGGNSDCNRGLWLQQVLQIPMPCLEHHLCARRRRQLHSCLLRSLGLRRGNGKFLSLFKLPSFYEIFFSFQDVPEARGRRDRQGVLHQRACRPSRLCWQQRLLGRVSITFLFPQHKNKDLFTMNSPKIRTSGWYKRAQTFSMPQAGLCPPWIVWRPQLSCHSPTVALPGQLSNWSIV